MKREAGKRTPGTFTGSYRFRVEGKPEPQGSARAFRRGDRVVITSDNPKNRSWRDIVGYAFRSNCHERLAAPVGVELEFIMPRTTSLPKRKATPPQTTLPDLDKLVRSVLDAGTEGGGWEDDARITSIRAEKRYAEPGEEPGVLIHAYHRGWIPADLFRIGSGSL